VPNTHGDDVTVIDPAIYQVVSADGSTLWLSGRYHNEVYALSTADGRLPARTPVGAGPHARTIWPQPGRYSLGHTGNIR
jgi:hypothetical protein